MNCSVVVRRVSGRIDELAGGLALLCKVLADQRHAETRRDERANHRFVVRFDQRGRRAATLLEEPGSEHVVGADRRRHQPRQRCDVGPLGAFDLVLPGGWRGDAVGDFAEWDRAHGGVREITVVEAGVQCPVAHFFESSAGDLVMQFDLEKRKPLGRQGQEVGKADEPGIGQGSDADMAGDRALHGTCLPVQRGRIRQDLGRFREQALAGGCQCHPGRAALEELYAKLVLERLDLRAQCRLAQVQPLGCAGEVTEFGDCRETA